MQVETAMLIKLFLSALLAYLSLRKANSIPSPEAQTLDPSLIPDIQIIEEEEEDSQEQERGQNTLPTVIDYRDSLKTRSIYE